MVVVVVEKKDVERKYLQRAVQQYQTCLPQLDGDDHRSGPRLGTRLLPINERSYLPLTKKSHPKNSKVLGSGMKVVGSA